MGWILAPICPLARWPFTGSTCPTLCRTPYIYQGSPSILIPYEMFTKHLLPKLLFLLNICVRIETHIICWHVYSVFLGCRLPGYQQWIGIAVVSRTAGVPVESVLLWDFNSIHVLLFNVYTAFHHRWNISSNCLLRGKKKKILRSKWSSSNKWVFAI